MDELQSNKRAPLSVFISYMHEDELLRQQLEAHLSLLRRQGWIVDWHDRQILAGDEWARDIDEHLETASIILLLISSHFLASDYCYDIEMQRALERHRRGEARVIPIILRPCDWKTSPSAHLQCLPRGGKAVTTWENQDEAFLSIAQGLRRVIEQRQIPARPLAAVERQNRTRLLKRVRTIWIEGLLDHSLQQAARLALHLQERPDVLVNPWRLQVQELDRPPQPLPPDTSIVQLYDEADGELLILGEPGAGKTTLLLELARTLLERAEAEERHRLPVVFNLSSWVQSRQPLADWLVEELWTKYQVPHKLCQVWIDTDQVLPLLDGLDEMAEDACSA
jgi:TIR domain/NACHT domain